MNPILNSYYQALENAFQNRDRYQAHQLAQPILKAMVQDAKVLPAILSQNLRSPDFFNKKRINPVLALDIFQNNIFTLVANCWFPLANHSQDYTHQSIHHHGKLLLTSAAAFGPGYESILYQKGYPFNYETLEAQLVINKVYRNPLQNIEFVDAFTPHVVFFPGNLSITYALWSYYQPQASEQLKQFTLLNQYKKSLKNLIKFLKLEQVLNLNKIEYLDFYCQQKKYFALKERIIYQVGSNANFIGNVFYLLQQTGYQNLELLKSINSANLNSVFSQFLNQFEQGQTIAAEFDPAHNLKPYLNLERQHLL